jgi:guanosine-3',5'-bis(diphosphate) 3'-pyrophosphohydrolase
MPRLQPTALVVMAAHFAAEQHREQRRKDGSAPYINHPLSVARRLVEVGGVGDPVVLAAAMLHDTVEDTDTTREELVARFGSEVADVVAEVTDDKSLPKAERKREQIRHGASMSQRARLVKLADKLDNLDGLSRSVPQGWDASRVQGYFVWGHAVVAEVRGANAGLAAALDEVFARDLRVADGAPFRAVPEDLEERDALLRAYLEAMGTAGE